MLPKFWDDTLLDNLYPQLYFYQFGEKRKVDRNSGTTFYIPRWKKEANVPFATTEGAIIGACPASAQFLSGTLKQFGGAHKHSDIVVMTSLSSVIEGSLRELSKALAKTVDTHIRNQLSAAAGSTFIGSKSAANSQTVRAASTIAPSDIIESEVTLDVNDNYRFPDGFYAGVIGPKTVYDIQVNLTGNSWLELNKYTNNVENVYRGEVGRMFGVRFITSSNIKRVSSGLSTTATSADTNHVIAPGAYHVVELDGMNAQTFVKGLGSAGTADPINQNATVGAKVFFQAVVK
jgi:N4-gp56 family major capsid protein